MSAIALTRSTASANGVKLAYVEQGQGVPLVLIMGLGADASAWELHLNAYRDHFRCFAVDNRGAGQSSVPPGPYSTADMAEDYAGFLEALSIPRARVVGISMGGAIAQELALRHPDLVERLVIVSSWGKCDNYAAELFHHFAEVRSRVPASEFSRLLQLWIWSPTYFDTHFAELVRERTQGSVVPMTLQAFKAQCAACIAHNTLDRLGNIKVPTLITAGEYDHFISLVHSEELHARISSSELHVFPGAGHAHHWEDLDRFNTLTANWLA